MNEANSGAAAVSHPSFLAGGGEMGALMRARDWAATPLGPGEDWPQSLKTAIRIMLTSRQPIWVGWGPDLLFFYNDAYQSIIGGRHPEALGRPTAIVWQEIWDDIGPMLATAMTGVEGTYVEEQLLIMERNGYPEETYYTFSYSPVPDDSGGTGGIICANSEDTRRVIGERQLSLLRELATRTANARSWQDACQRSLEALATNPRDLPFALLYLAEPGGTSLSLAGRQGIEPGHEAAPQALSQEAEWPWPAGMVLRRHEIVQLADIADRFAMPLPCGAWKHPPAQAAMLPIVSAGETGRAGLLIVGLNPYRLLDEDYKGFLDLVAGQIGAAIGNAEAYEEERRRAEALAEIDRAKTVFFSNISHEFRTPLTLMLGSLDELLGRETEPTARPLVEAAHRNSLRLLKLVNALLDFSRIESGRLEASYEPTDLAGFTRELASNFRAAMERAGLDFQVMCEPLPEPVYIDRDMWEKIVLNLLSNAFKFTLQGSVAVEVGCAADGAGAQLTVRDTGIGIAPQELPHLFERFHRIRGARGRTIEGSGIGLALVQELVAQQGGTIAVESAVGQGTVFTVTLPYGTRHLAERNIRAASSLAPASLRAQAFVEEALRWLPDGGSRAAELPLAEGIEAEPTGAAKARIVVADDNADLRDYMHRLLSAAGYAVETVADGAEALDAARRAPPDLVLSDIMMPELDGFGLLAALRADPLLRETPVLLLSARAGEEARVEGLAAGADDYLTKPFPARELLARVGSCLALARLRRETEAKLRELNESLEQRVQQAVAERDRLWELSEDLLVVADYSGRLLRVSPSWQRLLGHGRAALLAAEPAEYTHPDDRDRLVGALQELAATGRPVHCEIRMRTIAGDWRNIAWTLAPDPNEARLHGVGRDVTADREAAVALRQAEEALRAAQKMEAIGKLTGGVAHDFNNLLQVIGGNLQLLARDGGGERTQQRLRNALAGVARGSKLAAQLLAFGRRQPLAPKVVNLGRFVRGLDEMLRRALGDGIEIETIVSGGLWNTLVDPFQAENALINLAINARDAMAGHGRLTIEAGNALLDEAYALRHAEVLPGQYVMLAVTDTGCGMTPDVLEHVFEPFFTTKPEGQGTGLGLSMVYGFVKQSGGHVKIYSEPGQGTTIRLYLPRVRQEEDLATEIEPGPAAGGSETIMVVEDDEDVRTIVVDMLSDLGYRVLKAKDAQGALAIVESGMPVDLLFTDVVMPGPLRSPELARKARERIPGIAVLFTSGYTENAIVHGGRLDEGIELLSKPYTREALARKIRHVLRGQQQRNAASQPPIAPPSASAAGRLLRVLVVEDDELIRFTVTEMLGALGHEVSEAGNAVEALARLEAGSYEVLLADVTLPGMSGLDLAREALRRDPALRIVFASGRSIAPAERTGLERAVQLQKPYGSSDLAAALTLVMKG